MTRQPLHIVSPKAFPPSIHGTPWGFSRGYSRQRKRPGLSKEFPPERERELEAPNTMEVATRRLGKATSSDPGKPSKVRWPSNLGDFRF